MLEGGRGGRKETRDKRGRSEEGRREKKCCVREMSKEERRKVRDNER